MAHRRDSTAHLPHSPRKLAIRQAAADKITNLNVESVLVEAVRVRVLCRVKWCRRVQTHVRLGVRMDGQRRFRPFHFTESVDQREGRGQARVREVVDGETTGGVSEGVSPVIGVSTSH
jgi:hypothetical protein